jgi:hypothetical protein
MQIVARRAKFLVLVLVIVIEHGEIDDEDEKEDEDDWVAASPRCVVSRRVIPSGTFPRAGAGAPKRRSGAAKAGVSEAGPMRGERDQGETKVRGHADFMQR